MVNVYAKFGADWSSCLAAYKEHTLPANYMEHTHTMHYMDVDTGC